jgi:hypothetical protein
MVLDLESTAELALNEFQSVAVFESVQAVLKTPYQMHSWIGLANI